MDNLIALLDDRGKDVSEAKERLRTKEKAEAVAGAELRDASLRSLVRRDQLSDIGNIEGASKREKQGQRKRCVLMVSQPRPVLIARSLQGQPRQSFR